MSDNELDIRFKSAYQKSSAFKGKVPQDVMLKLYALYKIGLNETLLNSNQQQDMVSAFKANAMFQFSHYSPNECKEFYINLVEEYCK